MKAVADSSVFIALSLIGWPELLPRRFPEEILVPRVVWEDDLAMVELQDKAGFRMGMDGYLLASGAEPLWGRLPAVLLGSVT